MRKKALLIIIIWIVVAAVVLVLYFTREVSPVKDFVAWALSVWPILAAIGGAGAFLTTWVIKHDFNKKGKEHPSEGLTKRTANPLEDIKTNLIKINTLEREVASQKAKQLCPNTIAMHIHDDCLEIWGTDINRFIAPILHSVVIKHDPDPLIDFFKGFGDILDSNNYGLKAQLQNNEPYGSFQMDIAQKRLYLDATSRKKKSITQKNINRALSFIYGLNSSIILRGVLDSISTDEMRIPALVRVGLEGIETLGEQILNQMLDDLEHEWKPTINLAEFKEIVTKLNDVLGIVNARIDMAEGVTDMAKKNEEQELLSFYQRQKDSWKSYLRLRIKGVIPAVDADVPMVTFQMEMINYLPIQVKLVKVTRSSGNVSAGEFGSCSLPAFPESVDKRVSACSETEFSLQMEVGKTKLPDFLRGFSNMPGHSLQWILKGEWYVEVEGKTEVWENQSYNLIYNHVIIKHYTHQ